MSVTLSLPSPQTTLVIILGASEWPHDTNFEPSKAFERAASDFKNYFLDTFGLPPGNLCWLFDTSLNALDMDKEICKHLDMFAEQARDVLVYYTGHGGLTDDRSSLYLAVRETQEHDPESSSLRLKSLARTLRKKASDLRHFYILDCCFAASGQSVLQGTSIPNELVKSTLEDEEINACGYAGLFSSGKDKLSVILPTHKNTYFTEALLQVLLDDSSQEHLLSLKDVYLRLENRLKSLYKNYRFEYPHNPKPPRPQLYAGDIASIPFFLTPHIKVEQRSKAKEVQTDQQLVSSPVEKGVTGAPEVSDRIADSFEREIEDLGDRGLEQRPGQKALEAWRRLLSPEKMGEIQQLIKFLCAEEEVKAWIEGNQRLLSSEKMGEIQQLIKNYSRDSLYIQNLRITNRDLKTLLPVANNRRPIIYTARERQIQGQKLIEFLRSEGTVKAWIETNQKLLSPGVMEEIQLLINNFRPLSSKEIEELQQLQRRLEDMARQEDMARREKQNAPSIQISSPRAARRSEYDVYPLGKDDIEKIPSKRSARAVTSNRRATVRRSEWIFFIVGPAVLVLNLLGTSIELGILLHGWWITVICLIGETLLIGVGASFFFDVGVKLDDRIKLLASLLPIAIAWGLVGWFLTLSLGLAVLGFLLGLFVNFFIYLWLWLIT